MLLWRIAPNLLPNKDLAIRYSQHKDLRCLLCNFEEVSARLFTQCYFEKIIWYGSQWYLRLECLNLLYTSQLVETLQDPLHVFQFDRKQKAKLLLFGELQYHIWIYRNKAVHDDIVGIFGAWFVIGPSLTQLFGVLILFFFFFGKKRLSIKTNKQMEKQVQNDQKTPQQSLNQAAAKHQLGISPRMHKYFIWSVVHVL